MMVSERWIELWRKVQEGEGDSDELRVWELQAEIEWLIWLEEQLFDAPGKGQVLIDEEVNQASTELMLWFGTRTHGMVSAIMNEIKEDGVESYAAIVMGGTREADVGDVGENGGGKVVIHTTLWDVEALRNLKELSEMLIEGIEQGPGQSKKVREWGDSE